MNRTVWRLGNLVTIPVIFNFVQVFLKKFWRTEPQAFHMKYIPRTKQSIIDQVLEEVYPPIGSVSPEKWPPSFNSLIGRWGTVSMRLWTCLIILLIATKDALHGSGNAILWSTISYKEQRATSYFLYLFEEEGRRYSWVIVSSDYF